jgi:hypothetical protein
MKTYQKVILYFCVIATIFQSCNETASTNQQSDQQASTEQQEVNTTYLMTSDAFFGLRKNEKIPSDLEKSVLETGEGNFDIFLITDDDGTLGYIHPDMDDELLIGSMVITSQKVFTPHGLSVGMTFGKLQEKYPNVEVYGSEIEGYTSAMIEDIYYALAFNHWSYDLDAKLIPSDTKIIEISN